MRLTCLYAIMYPLLPLSSFFPFLSPSSLPSSFPFSSPGSDQKKSSKLYKKSALHSFDESTQWAIAYNSLWGLWRKLRTIVNAQNWSNRKSKGYGHFAPSYVLSSVILRPRVSIKPSGLILEEGMIYIVLRNHLYLWILLNSKHLPPV